MATWYLRRIGDGNRARGVLEPRRPRGAALGRRRARDTCTARQAGVALRLVRRKRLAAAAPCQQSAFIALAPEDSAAILACPTAVIVAHRRRAHCADVPQRAGQGADRLPGLMQGGMHPPNWYPGNPLGIFITAGVTAVDLLISIVHPPTLRPRRSARTRSVQFDTNGMRDAAAARAVFFSASHQVRGRGRGGRRETRRRRRRLCFFSFLSVRTCVCACV